MFKKSAAKTKGKSLKDQQIQPEMDDQDCVKIVVSGDVESGKTSLVKKFFIPSTEVFAWDEQAYNYWSYQMNTVATIYSYKNVNFKFVEVPASRGRSSNYHLVKKAMENVDGVLHCQKLYNRWEEAEETFLSYISYAHNQTKHFCGEENAKTIPFFCFGTFADIKALNSDSLKSKLQEDGVSFYEVSAHTNQGIQESFTDFLDNILANTTKGRMLVAKAQKVDAVSESTTVSTTDTTVAANDTTTAKTAQRKTFVTKILSLFGLKTSESVDAKLHKPDSELMASLTKSAVDPTVITAPSA